MPDYKIKITNKSGSDSQFGIFTAPPVVNDVTNDPNVFTNVWLSKSVASGAEWETEAVVNFYAWNGTIKQELEPGVTVKVGQPSEKPVQLGSNNPVNKKRGSTFFVGANDDKGAPKWVIDPKAQDIGNDGSYAIKTLKDFTKKDRYLIGMGKMNKDKEIVPVACWVASPGFTYQIQPVLKYYVSMSDFVPGKVVNYAASASEAAEVDFSSDEAVGKFSAMISVDERNNWSITYKA